MKTLKINISNLQDGELDYDFIISAGELEIDEVRIVSDITIKANLYKTGNQFDINVKLKGKFKLQCDRCIEYYEQEFDNSFEVIYKYDFSTDEIENEEDDIKFISPKTSFINLMEDVRDYIVLSIPMKHVPPEINNVCIYCNRDTAEILKIESKIEVSPVWEKLIKQKSK